MTQITIREEAGVRYLHFGSEWVQGAMRVARPASLELEYTRELMFPLLLRPGASWPASVLQVGLGSASVTRFLHRHRPRARLTVAEIAPEVIAAARQFFKLPDSPRLRIEVADGHDYVAASDREYDLIVVDGYDERGRTGMLDTLPFYVNCRARLSPRGLAVVNLVDRRRGAAVASAARIAAAFDGRALALPPSGDGNTIALAAAGEAVEATVAQLARRAIALRTATGLELAPSVKRLAARLGPRGRVSL
ncbi:MAG TPA: fused MFS/spermidine synthase [Usitatibacter sp.]|nr:fused MFS/spermidine synthase [Usitatibacter sp.]